MVFHVRITFNQVKSKDGHGPIALGDTILVSEDTPALLTGNAPRTYKHISYTISDEEEEKGSEEEDELKNGSGKKRDSNGYTNDAQLMSTRTRG